MAVSAAIFSIVSVQIRRQREFGRASDRSPPELGQVGGDVRSGSFPLATEMLIQRQEGLVMQLGCWRSATSGRCRGCADSEVGPAVRIRFPPAASQQRTRSPKNSCIMDAISPRTRGAVHGEPWSRPSNLRFWHTPTQGPAPMPVSRPAPSKLSHRRIEELRAGAGMGRFTAHDPKPTST
jgi:hypothetical protein